MSLSDPRPSAEDFGRGRHGDAAAVELRVRERHGAEAALGPAAAAVAASRGAARYRSYVDIKHNHNNNGSNNNNNNSNTLDVTPVCEGVGGLECFQDRKALKPKFCRTSPGIQDKTHMNHLHV